MLRIRKNLYRIGLMFLSPSLSGNLQAVARRTCELCDWNISNLQLQKILYIANMLHLAEHGEPIIDEKFQAWDYGPVIPDLYKAARMYGADSVRDMFWHEHIEKQTVEDALKRVCAKTKNYSGGKLVAITHWEDGAWAKRYKPNVPNIVITDEDIIEEYHARLGKG